MTLRLVIKGDAMQIRENDFYNPCRTVDIDIPDGTLDAVHEYVVGVEVIKSYQQKEKKSISCNEDYCEIVFEEDQQ